MIVEAAGYRQVLRELYDAVTQEVRIETAPLPLKKAYLRAFNVLKSTDPPRECPHCKAGVTREKFNSRYFHELPSGGTVTCYRE